MNKRQKEVLLKQFKTEEEFLKELEKIYQKALDDINDKIKILQASDLQSKIYQRQYQEALKGQVEAILEMLHSQEYTKIEDYLDNCYRDAFIGSLYDLQGQNVPLILPIDQEQVVKALQLDSQISEGLYKRLGEDITTLKKTISEEISRGISSSLMYSDIARNISNVTNTGYSNAKRIVVTEGHRIQNESALECARQAKKRGADSVKVWDSTLDGKTRDTHRQLDGQIREVEEPFEVAGKKAMYPGGFGDPAEDCNCRCALLQKARWNLDADETKYLGNVDNMSDADLQPLADKLHIPVSELRSYSGQIIPLKAKSYDDFKRQYNQIWHYEGSDLQKEAEARIAGYKKGRASK